MGLGSEIKAPGTGQKPIPDPGSGSRVKKAPDSGSATLTRIMYVANLSAQGKCFKNTISQISKR